MLWLAAVGCRQCEYCHCKSYRTVTDFDITGNGDVFVRATDSSPSDKTNDLPLSGVRVLELGQLIAGPFTGQLLGYVAAFLLFRSTLARVLKCGLMGQIRAFCNL